MQEAEVHLDQGPDEDDKSQQKKDDKSQQDKDDRSTASSDSEWFYHVPHIEDITIQPCYTGIPKLDLSEDNQTTHI